MDVSTRFKFQPSCDSNQLTGTATSSVVIIYWWALNFWVLKPEVHRVWEWRPRKLDNAYFIPLKKFEDTNNSKHIKLIWLFWIDQWIPNNTVPEFATQNFIFWNTRWYHFIKTVRWVSIPSFLGSNTEDGFPYKQLHFLWKFSKNSFTLARDPAASMSR